MRDGERPVRRDEAVGEVEVRARGNAGEQRVLRRAGGKINGVPAHVRDLVRATLGILARHAIHASGQHAQTTRVAVGAGAFHTFLEQQMLSQADAQKRHPLRDAAADDLGLAELVHGCRGVGERAHARQDDGIGGGYLGGIVGDAGIGARRAQTALDGQQIALLVVNNSDHRRLLHLAGPIKVSEGDAPPNEA